MNFEKRTLLTKIQKPKKREKLNPFGLKNSTLPFNLESSTSQQFDH